jgi:hypothetical protein
LEAFGGRTARRALVEPADARRDGGSGGRKSPIPAQIVQSGQEVKMAASSLLALITPPVHAKPEVTAVNPDGRNAQQQEHRKRERQAAGGSPHPVPNAQGQITGKVIDTTA